MQKGIKVCWILACWVLAGETHAIGQGQAESISNKLEAQYGKTIPKLWSENVPGVKTRLKTKEKWIALTLDACPPREYGYDVELIQFLVQEQIPATLFISGKWIDRFPKTFQELAHNPLFEIANHGLEHKPCSGNGKTVYGLQGTASVTDIVNEVEGNADKIKQTIGRYPGYYRAGGNYYDEVGVAVVESLGATIVGYSIAGDGGATFSKEKIREACLNAVPGSIILCHMNHPEGETAEGLMLVLPELRKNGFKFVKLSDCDLE